MRAIFFSKKKRERIIFKTINYNDFMAPINCQEYRNLIQNNKIGQEKLFFEYLSFFKLKKKALNKNSNFIVYDQINFFYSQEQSSTLKINTIKPRNASSKEILAAVVEAKGLN